MRMTQKTAHFIFVTGIIRNTDVIKRVISKTTDNQLLELTSPNGNWMVRFSIDLDAAHRFPGRLNKRVRITINFNDPTLTPIVEFVRVGDVTDLIRGREIHHQLPLESRFDCCRDFRHWFRGKRKHGKESYLEPEMAGMIGQNIAEKCIELF